MPSGLRAPRGGEGGRVRARRNPCVGREPSVRKDARERYLTAAQAEHRTDERAEPAADITPLTQRVRALYEDSVVPVREIARLAGVSERTLYKYVAKGGWRRRHVRVARDGAVAVADRGRKMRTQAEFAPVQGTGGRFIARDQVGVPQAHGLKALDPDGARESERRCERAGVLAEASLAEAVGVAQARRADLKAERAMQAQLRMHDVLMGALIDLAKWERDAAPSCGRAAKRLADALADAIFAAMKRVVAS